MLEDATTERERLEDDIRKLFEEKQESNIQLKLDRYLPSLNLSAAQAQVFDVIRAELEETCQPLAGNVIEDYQLQSEYKLSELRETGFQMRHLTEQGQLDLKRLKIAVESLGEHTKAGNEFKLSINLLEQKSKKSLNACDRLDQYQQDQAQRFENLRLTLAHTMHSKQ